MRRCRIISLRTTHLHGRQSVLSLLIWNTRWTLWTHTVCSIQKSAEGHTTFQRWPLIPSELTSGIRSLVTLWLRNLTKPYALSPYSIHKTHALPHYISLHTLIDYNTSDCESQVTLPLPTYNHTQSQYSSALYLMRRNGLNSNATFMRKRFT